VPDLAHFAHLALEAGAAGLTVHPRPDERHIRGSDVALLAEVMGPRRPGVEFNIEGYPDERLMTLIRPIKPEQVTLVPDSPDAFTSEEGWRLGKEQASLIARTLPPIKALGSRLILFVDPDPAVVAKVRDSGADGIEIYTGGFAAAYRTGAHGAILEAIAATANAARQAGLVVNAGHDLNLDNIPPLVQAVPFLAEASIGHELTADALERGFPATVAAYVKALAG
jgi:pyridoxine 5-phosphate synthase